MHGSYAARDCTGPVVATDTHDRFVSPLHPWSLCLGHHHSLAIDFIGTIARIVTRSPQSCAWTRRHQKKLVAKHSFDARCTLDRTDTLHRGKCNHCSIGQPSMTRRSYIAPGGTSSWGMSVARDPKTGTFHGFVSEFVNGCKLGSWTSNSCVPVLSMVAMRACVPVSHALPRALVP